jgi:hypothetical protein
MSVILLSHPDVFLMMISCNFAADAVFYVVNADIDIFLFYTCFFAAPFYNDSI